MPRPSLTIRFDGEAAWASSMPARIAASTALRTAFGMTSRVVVTPSAKPAVTEVPIPRPPSRAAPFAAFAALSAPCSLSRARVVASFSI